MFAEPRADLIMFVCAVLLPQVAPLRNRELVANIYNMICQMNFAVDSIGNYRCDSIGRRPHPQYRTASVREMSSRIRKVVCVSSTVHEFV